MRLPVMLLTFGAALGVAGLWVGFTPIDVGGRECGSAFRSNVEGLEFSGGLYQLGSAYRGTGISDGGFYSAAANCQEQINSTKPLAIGLIVVGGAAALAGLVGNTRRPQSEPAGGLSRPIAPPLP